MSQPSRNQERDDAGRTGRGRQGEARGAMPAPYREERDLGPFARMNQLSREIDRMFEGLWRGPLGLLADRRGRGNGEVRRDAEGADTRGRSGSSRATQDMSEST